MNILRHGDVTLQTYNGKIEGQEVKHNGLFKLALGETTGHSHKLTVPKVSDMEIYETAFGRIIRLKTDGTLTHEEHKTITIPAGDYIQKQEREMDWFQKTIRKVLD